MKKLPIKYFNPNGKAPMGLAVQCKNCKKRWETKGTEPAEITKKEIRFGWYDGHFGKAKIKCPKCKFVISFTLEFVSESEWKRMTEVKNP